MIKTEQDKRLAEALGPRLANIRRAQDITQYDLADKLGVKQPMVAAYETGKKSISVRRLVQVAKVLGVSTDQLLGLQDEALRKGKRGPKSRLDLQLEQVVSLPPEDQKLVGGFLDKVLAVSATKNE